VGGGEYRRGRQLGQATPLSQGALTLFLTLPLTLTLALTLTLTLNLAKHLA